MKRNYSRAEIKCGVCGEVFTVPRHRQETAKYCGKRCSGSAQAERFLNKGPKPWAAATLAKHRHKSTSRFKRGNTPWNKNLKGIHLSPESEFKPGRESEKTMPIGSATVRVDKSGKHRAWVKTADGWVLRAQLVYIAKHGEIPDGHVIHHVDGDSLNDRPSNLKALTRAEHMNEHRDDLRKADNA